MNAVDIQTEARAEAERLERECGPDMAHDVHFLLGYLIGYARTAKPAAGSVRRLHVVAETVDLLAKAVPA